MTKEIIKEEIEDKAMHEVASEDGFDRMAWLPSGIVSFEEFDAMTEAKQQAAQVKNEASLLKAMIENIMNLEPEDGQDKPQMIVDVTNEFAARVQNPVEKEITETKELHYKEVLEDDTKATDDDFQGGCPHCEFGDDIVKSLDKCPYCYGIINEPLEQD